MTVGSGSCVDSSNKKFGYFIASSDDSSCIDPPFQSENKAAGAALCECLMAHYNGANALKGAFVGKTNINFYEYACYYDSTFDCAGTIKFPSQCFTGSGGTGSITGTGPNDSDYGNGQSCLAFTSTATGAPVSVTSSPVTSAPVTSAPITMTPTSPVAPSTPSPTKTTDLLPPVRNHMYRILYLSCICSQH